MYTNKYREDAQDVIGRLRKVMVFITVGALLSIGINIVRMFT